MFNHLLTVFVCAADCGSFNKAAEKLYLSAPSVMKQVNALEKQLDMKLFHRTNQGLHLTPAGQVIYRHAKYLFSYSRNAIAEARAAASLSEKTFCIGSSLLNPCKPFMDLWYKVNASFPGYRLHIVPFEDDHQGILTEISSLGKNLIFSSESVTLRSGWTAVTFCPSALISTAFLCRVNTGWRQKTPAHRRSLWRNTYDGKTGRFRYRRCDPRRDFEASTDSHCRCSAVLRY